MSEVRPLEPDLAPPPPPVGEPEPDAARTAIATELALVATELIEARRKSKNLNTHRDALLLAGRQLTPPMTQPELARAAQMQEGAVAQVLRKFRLNGQAT